MCKKYTEDQERKKCETQNHHDCEQMRVATTRYELETYVNGNETQNIQIHDGIFDYL